MPTHALDPHLDSLRREFDSACQQSAERARREQLQTLNQLFRRFRAYQTESDWVQTTLDAASPFAAHIAIFAITGDTLKLRGQSPSDVLPSDLTFPLSTAAAFANAIESKDPVTTLLNPAEVSTALTNGSHGQRAHIFPIANGDRISALLFAADPGVDMNALELIAGLASSVLERRSNQTLHAQITTAPTVLAPAEVVYATEVAESATTTATPPTEPAYTIEPAQLTDFANPTEPAQAIEPAHAIEPQPSPDHEEALSFAPSADPAPINALTPEPPPQPVTVILPPIQLPAPAPLRSEIQPIPSKAFAPSSIYRSLTPPSFSQPVLQTLPPESRLPAWTDLPMDQRQLHIRAQRFARVAIAELQLARPEACRAGREQNDLYLFLKREIDKARENYRKQFMTVPSMVDYLHLELIQTAAQGDEHKLGADYPGRLV